MRQWQTTPATGDRTALVAAFEVGTGDTLQQGFFRTIYAPFKTPTASGMPDTYTWENVGFTGEEIAEIYLEFFGENYLVEKLRLYPSDAFAPLYHTAPALLGRRILAVLNANKEKYKKLIELEGYNTYNPLWNVDGEEIYSSLENQGVNDETVSVGIDRTDWANTETVNQTNRNTYEGTSQPAETVTTTAAPAEDSQGRPTKNYTRTRAEPEDNTTERVWTHHNADNNGSDYTVSASDTAFGQAATGGDKYHTDKRIRRGNIGITASQDLIEKTRAVVNWSILQEFFRDINEKILVGIYDY